MNKKPLIEESADPMFNSGIAYLKRIDEAIRILHKKMDDNAPIKMMLNPLDSLYLEIAGRLRVSKLKDDIKEADKLKQYINTCKINPVYTNFLTAFEHLMVSAHRHKLIMPDKEGVDTAFQEMFKR